MSLTSHVQSPFDVAISLDVVANTPAGRRSSLASGPPGTTFTFTLSL
jgi:hypothetical protein